MLEIVINYLELYDGFEPTSSAWKAEVLPLYEYSILADATGLEPATSCVTGRHSTRLNYTSILVEEERVELSSLGYRPSALSVVLLLHIGHPEGTRTLKYLRERQMTVTNSSTGRFYFFFLFLA